MTPDPAFHVDAEREGGSVRVAVAGELDIATLPQLEAAVARVREQDAPRRLVLDFRRLRFLDSMSIEFLLRLDADQASDGGELLLVRGPRSVNRLFELMELDKVLAMVDEPPAA